MAFSELSNLNGKLKVLSFGAGAIGTYIGGSLALAGHQVVFVENPAVVDELRDRGLRLDLTLDKRRKTNEAFRITPPSFQIVSSLDDALRYGPFDVALFALKSFDTEAALEGMKPYADKMPPILCLSNGVSNEPAIARVLGSDKVIYGTVTSAIGRRGRGRHCPGETAWCGGCQRASSLGETEQRPRQGIPAIPGCSTTLPA